MKNILVVHGPNLNLLGTRETELYGNLTLDDINGKLSTLGKELGVSVSFYQSNSEGDLVNEIQGALEKYEAIVINPGA